MSYEFPVPDTSSLKLISIDLLFPDRISKMKQHICMTCSGKVKGFDTMVSIKLLSLNQRNLVDSLIISLCILNLTPLLHSSNG